MIFQKERNQLTDRSKMKTDLLALATDKNIHVSEFYKSFFERINLEYKGECSLKELIIKVQESGLKIMSVLQIDFVEDVIIGEVFNSTKTKMCFRNLMVENSQLEQYDRISENLNKVFILDELELKSPVSSNITGYAFIYLRGLEKGEATILLNRTEVMCIKIPY
jgi:hypothetical protein